MILRIFSKIFTDPYWHFWITLDPYIFSSGSHSLSLQTFSPGSHTWSFEKNFFQSLSTSWVKTKPADMGCSGRIVWFDKNHDELNQKSLVRFGTGSSVFQFFTKTNQCFFLRLYFDLKFRLYSGNFGLFSYFCLKFYVIWVI